MIKKRNQLITLIATPTIDLKGLYGVLSGAALGLSHGQDSGIGGFKSIIDSDAPEGNLPIA